MSEFIDHNPKPQIASEAGDPYDWDACTVRLSLTFLPTEQGARRVILGCNTHNDPPLIETVYEKELGDLPLLVKALLDQLKRRLPERAKQQAEVAAQENARLARQATDERSNAAVSTPQALLPNVQEEVRDGVTTDAMPFHEVIPAASVTGKQQSLFG